MGSYAYHLGVGNGKLSLGVRAGIYGQSIDFTNIGQSILMTLYYSMAKRVNTDLTWVLEYTIKQKSILAVSV
jgi:hypothetical protein